MTENKRFYIMGARTIKDSEKPLGEGFVIASYLTDAKELCNLLNQLNDENEELKQTMKEVLELLSDEVDLFSDEAIEHDINAYVELKELDNKDAFYMAKATKTAIKMLKGDVE